MNPSGDSCRSNGRSTILTADGDSDPSRSRCGQRYLLLADISGYTGFLNGVEQAHGVDFSSGIPAGYEVLGALLDAVVEGVQPAFDIAKLEGDAVFAVAPAEGLDGQGEAVLDRLRAVYRAFYRRTRAREERLGPHLHSLPRRR